MKWGAITVPTEEQMQLYEKAPLKYRNEVKDATERIEKRFHEQMNRRDKWSKRYVTIEDTKEDSRIQKIWSRLIKLTIKISSYDHKEFMKKYGYARRQTQRITAIQSANNIDAHVRKVELDAAMQMIRLFPVRGEA